MRNQFILGNLTNTEVEEIIKTILYTYGENDNTFNVTVPSNFMGIFVDVDGLKNNFCIDYDDEDHLPTIWSFDNESKLKIEMDIVEMNKVSLILRFINFSEAHKQMIYNIIKPYSLCA